MAKWSKQAQDDLARIRKSGALLPEKVQALERDIDTWSSGAPAGQASTRAFNVREMGGGYSCVTAKAEPVNGALQVVSLVETKLSSEIGVNVTFSPSAREDLASLKAVGDRVIGGDYKHQAEMLETEAANWAKKEAESWPDGSIQVSGRLGLDESISSWRAVAWRSGIDIQVNVQIVRLYFA